MVNIKSREYDFGASKNSGSDLDFMKSTKRHSMQGPDEIYGASIG